MKILFISYDFPYPPTGGSISRDYNLIKQLSKHHELHWINRTITGEIKQEYKDEMKKYFKEMNIIDWDYKQTAKGLITSLVSNVPYIIKRFESSEVRKIVEETISRNNFDLILCDHIYLSQYIPANVIGKIPVIPNNEDCGFTYYKRMAESTGFVRSSYGALQWKKLLNYEIEALKKFKVYLTTSEKEKELISQYYNKAEIGVIENGVDTEYFNKLERKDFHPNIVFTAWFKYYPNVSAAVEFAQNIFPRIKLQIPDIKFYIVGKEPPAKVKDLEKIPGVVVTGYVDDVRTYLKNADVAVVPLKIGGGTRLKILEALAMKIPVVSTVLGAEGLDIEDGKNILIADNNDDFAAKVIKVVKDKTLAKMLCDNGRMLVTKTYDWELIGNKLNYFVNDFVKKFNEVNEYDLLIQIINYNTKKYLEVCLNSLFADLEDSGINYHIAVLDNNSNDDLSDMEQSFRNRISFIRSDKNLGFGGGHNYISKLFKSKYTLILNSDLKFINKHTIKTLYDNLKRNSEYSVIGPKLVEEDLKPQRFDHGELKGFISMIKNNYGASYWKPRNRPIESAWVSGAVFMINSDVFNKVEGFDEKFFLYKEEEDLCRRIRNSGEKILYDPTVSVMHYGHVVAKRSEHFSKSMEYYLDKHFRHNLSYRVLHSFKILKDLILHGRVMERK